MVPLRLIYNGVNLHDLGSVSVMSQSSQFSPDELPQKETRTVHVRIDTWERDTGYNYDLLYANLQAARAALSAQNKILKWTSPGDSAAGEVNLERPVTVVSHDLPEDPNAWGVYHQQINIVFRYELDVDPATATLQATVRGSGGSPATLSLGKVYTWRDDYRNNFYSEWRNFRERSTGSISVTGEIFRALGETGVSNSAEDNRLAQLVGDLEELKAQLSEGAYIRLTYGPSDNRFFDRGVKVEAFSADINQSAMVGSIHYSLTVSFTKFPNEDAYAAAEFSSSLSQDKETGEDTLGISGRVRAATESLALGKLAALTSTITAAYGFNESNLLRPEVAKQWINAEDTGNANAFIELAFNYSYRKKSANILAYTLTVSDAEDLKSGLLTRTYSGSVVASATTEDAAYAAALAKARELGDRKHPFRVSASESRNDRQTVSQADKEFVRLEFNYQYQVKGERMFLQLNVSTTDDTYGESQERVSGFVVAKDQTTARGFYQSLVKSLYTGRNIRQETIEDNSERVQLGEPWFTGTGSLAMWQRMEFSLAVFKPKATGAYAIKYGIRVRFDYLALQQLTTLEGVFAAGPDQIAALEAGNANALDTFIAATAGTFGSLKSKELDYDKEKVGTGAAETVAVRFALEFQKRLTTAATILQCSMREDITYSATRWVFQQRPDGADIAQDCGITQAVRVVSGSVTAATETAALNWIKAQHGASGLWQTWSDTSKPADADRFEEAPQITTSFDFAPLIDGAGRGTGKNFQVVVKEFTFREIIPILAAPF